MTEFKVNEYLKVKLEDDSVNIYVNDAQFLLCKHLKLVKSEENESLSISPETEFWGHCSALQAWAENNYSLYLLDKHFAMTLLKELRKAGDVKAKEALNLLTNCVYCNQVLSKTDAYCPNCGKFILNPDNPRWRGSFDINKLKVEFITESHHLEAIKKYKMELRKDSQNIEALYLLGKSYYILKNRRAIACFKKAINIDPSNKKRYTGEIIKSYIRIKKFPKALKLCERELEKYPHDADYLIIKGSIHAYLGEYDKALTIYNNFLDKDSASVFFWIGFLYYQNAEFNKALKTIRQGLHISNTKTLRSMKWRVQYEISEPKKLIPVLKKKLNDQKKKDWFYLTITNLLGHIYLKSGKYYKAVKYIKEGIDPLFHLSFIYTIRRNYTKAAKICMKSIKNDKKDENKWSNLGLIYAEMLNFEKAERAIKIALAINPYSNSSKVHLAYIKIKLKQLDEAITICDEILTKVPNFPFGLLYKGIAYYEKGNFDEALKLIEKVLNIMPNWDYAKLYLAKIYHHQNRLDKALDIIKRRSNPYSYGFFELIDKIMNI